MTTPCPDRDQLRRLFDGDTGVSDHVAGCGACQAVLDELTDVPELAEFRRAAPLDGDDLTPLLDRLRGLPGPAREVPRTIGPFDILGEIGRGGMGVVYRAHDSTLGRTVAVKRLRTADADSRRRLLAEARAAAGLRHPAVIPVYAVADPPDDDPYLVMPFIDGPSLRQRLRDGALSPAEAAKIVAAVADGLAAAHAAGLVHRDVKPGNILLDENGPRLIDFGLARAADQTATSLAAAGTPEYMSPEQVRSPDRVDGRSDVYSLGVTLYECLTGSPPFRGPAPAVARRILDDDPIPPRRTDDRIPRDLETICLKAMAKEPGRRYSSAALLRDDLHRFLEGKPITARPVGPLERAWRWARRRPVVSGLAASLVLTLAGGFAASFALWQRAERQRDRAEAHLATARRAVDQFFTRVYEQGLLNDPKAQPHRKPLLQEAREFYTAMLRRETADPRLKADAAETAFRLGWLTRETGPPLDAVPLFRQSAALYRELAAASPESKAYRERAARADHHVGGCYEVAGQWDEAERHERAAADEMAEMARRWPDDLSIRRNAAVGAVQLGVLAHNRGNLAVARAAYERAVGDFEALCRADPKSTRHRADCGRTYFNLGLVSESAGAKRAWFEKALAVRAELAAGPDAGSVLFHEIARTHLKLGELAEGAGDVSAALATFERALAAARTAVERDPQVRTFRPTLADVLLSRSDALVSLGRFDEALASALEGRAIYAELSQSDPARHAPAWAKATGPVVAALRGLGRSDEADEVGRAVMDELTRLPPSPGRDAAVAEARKRFATPKSDDGK